MLQIVVARHEENLSWLVDDEVLSKIDRIIYNKGSDLCGSVELPNIGREAHTWLYHILTNYNSLAEYTAFVQGYPFDHMPLAKQALSHFPRSLTLLKKIPGCYCFTNRTWDDKERDAMLWLRKDFDAQKGCVVERWRKLFPWITFGKLFRNYPPSTFTFAMGAQYIVHRKNITNKPLKFYQRAMKVLDWDDCDAWNMERLWLQLFDPDDKWLARY